VELARGKLTGKGLDALVVNDISREDIGFDVDANEVTILCAGEDGAEVERREVARASKAQVAEAILDAVEGLRARR
jgi:phosphopantothenoylcysteine decarboxylase/phosphopantothenate--cysteine ligase